MIAVIFPVDTERANGQMRITNEEVAEEVAQHRDPVFGRYARLQPVAPDGCC